MSDIVQRSPEWFAARLGIATASRFSAVLAKIKTGESAERRNYRAQLVVERLTRKPVEMYQNAAMQHGTDQEPFARMAFAAKSDAIVDEVGFLRHADIEAGCSPDGLIDEDGMIEIKCPFQTAIHIETLISGMPKEHVPQVQGQMWIAGRAWVDFISFDPRMPDKLQLFVQRIPRDDEYIEILSKEISAFMEEVKAEEEQLLKLAA
jgi:hypothetical protein